MLVESGAFTLVTGIEINHVEHLRPARKNRCLAKVQLGWRLLRIWKRAGARVVESHDEAAQHVTESFFFQEMLERAISPSHALPKDLSFARHGMGFFGFF